mgnify:FL=1|tara:strand:- start:187 stop:408 length:222 start_codon:yes stop_codon:yes gene_type:complete
MLGLFLPDLFGGNEQMAYDVQRAHSADILFIKMKATMWLITFTTAGFLIGNIMGVFDINVLQWIWDNTLGHLL